MNKKFAVSCCAALCLTSLWACSTKETAGGVDEQTNTLAGVLTNGGVPMARVPVVARYVSVDSIEFRDTTDENGKFGFPLLRYGTYALSSVSDSLGVYRTVEFLGSKQQVELSMARTFGFEGSLTRDGSRQVEGAYVYLPGSSWETYVDSQGKFLLENVPAGQYMLFAKSPDPARYVNAAYVMDVSEEGSSVAGPLPTSMISSLEVLKESEAFDRLMSTASEDNSMALPLSTEYGLISLWSMDYVRTNGEFMSTTDARGRVGDMALYGMDGLVTGFSGKAVLLDSPSKFGVVDKDNGVLDSAAELTLELMIQVDSVDEQGSYRRNIIGKLGFDEKDKNVFSFALINKDCGAEKPSIAFFIADGSGDSLSCKNAVVSKEEIDFGTWTHYVVSWDGKNISLYKNGYLDAEEVVAVKVLEPSEEPMFLGKENINVRLDDVRLGAKAIGSADVLYRYYLRGGSL